MMERTPILIIGPCVIESDVIMNTIAERIVKVSEAGKFSVFFKASFDKSNRTSYKSYRGPGLEKGLEKLSQIKKRFGLKILTDIHESWQADPVSEVADIIQIPAFLCGQTDLIQSAARTKKVVNIKKGQFRSGEEMAFAVEKARVSGASSVFVTERGNSFGYNNLVVDFRNVTIMKGFADAVIMDCTHSVQKPPTTMAPQFVKSMALAAKAFGADGYFFEVHPSPQNSMCDANCVLDLSMLDSILAEL